MGMVKGDDLTAVAALNDVEGEEEILAPDWDRIDTSA
jgi:hypothetical protein